MSIFGTVYNEFLQENYKRSSEWNYNVDIWLKSKGIDPGKKLTYDEYCYQRTFESRYDDYVERIEKHNKKYNEKQKILSFEEFSKEELTDWTESLWKMLCTYLNSHNKIELSRKLEKEYCKNYNIKLYYENKT